MTNHLPTCKKLVLVKIKDSYNILKFNKKELANNNIIYFMLNIEKPMVKRLIYFLGENIQEMPSVNVFKFNSNK